MALDRGVALPSANVPLFVSSTGALTYTQDLSNGTIALNMSPVLLTTLQRPTPINNYYIRSVALDQTRQQRKPVLLVSIALAVMFIAAVVELAVVLVITIRTTVVSQSSPKQNLIVPTLQTPAYLGV
ncbi:hypothetical protein [Mycobacterium lepromatosis]|uniref:hypothetical protein n=1 Tax=Mycobacterium lepromatosis TaxID=480418 RepID=UPI0005F7D26D|nr:hypothetical protein [Mycobacterium lepromatosis]